MKYRFKKGVEKKTSLAVIRAVTRLNDHAHQPSLSGMVNRLHIYLLHHE